MPHRGKQTVLWLDGCFDGFHYAHANAVRQALTLVPGPAHVIVGVHSDAEIERNKGPPLFDEGERYGVMKGCRWIDVVVEDVPYVTQLDVIDKYHVDYVVHGDDAVMDAEGNDCYATVKAAGRYKECKRTAGISTTSMIQRILEPSRQYPDEEHLQSLLDAFVSSISSTLSVIDLRSPYDNLSPLPRVGDVKYIYVGGSWDCFGFAHVQYLQRVKEAASSMGNYKIVVGVWSDETVLEETGEQPLLVVLERTLAVVQCLYTDALIISAPRTISPQVTHDLNIDLVVNENADSSKFIQVPVPELQTLESLRAKVLGDKHQAFIERQSRKVAS